ncbi:TIGR03668 family PPOX class F420-dependent oxidoreductase [Actinomycetota bacterium Odt1-20B]
MRLELPEAKRRFTSARVLRLASTDAADQPHLVPATFAVRGDTVVIAVDHKPKNTFALKRLGNIAANPRVSVLVDQYDDEWEQLWWVRADGTGRVLTADEDRREPVLWLCDKYRQYRERPPEGPVISIDVQRWVGWAFAEPEQTGM